MAGPEVAGVELPLFGFAEGAVPGDLIPDLAKNLFIAVDLLVVGIFLLKVQKAVYLSDTVGTLWEM